MKKDKCCCGRYDSDKCRYDSEKCHYESDQCAA